MTLRHRLYQRGKRGTWWVDFGVVGGVRHKRSTGHTDPARAATVAAQLADELGRHRDTERIKKLTIAEAAPPWAAALDTPEARAVFARLWRNARSRARQADKVWALSEADFQQMVRASNGRCAVTGLPFCITEDPRHPFKPSLDRIDNSTGYSIGNTRLVLLAVNMAMNVWGAEVFDSIALSYAASRLQSAVQFGNSASRDAGTTPKWLI